MFDILETYYICDWDVRIIFHLIQSVLSMDNHVL